MRLPNITEIYWEVLDIKYTDEEMKNRGTISATRLSKSLEKENGINLEVEAQKFLQVAGLDINLLRIFVHQHRDVRNEF
jgi:hypothetical protein